MPSEVKRYDLCSFDTDTERAGAIRETCIGAYVLHSDYAAKDAECERLRKALEEIAARCRRERNLMPVDDTDRAVDWALQPIHTIASAALRPTQPEQTKTP